MDVMFVKDYVDADSFDMPVFIKATTIGTLLDETTDKIYIEKFGITLNFVEKTSYAPLRDDYYEEKEILTEDKT